MIYIFLLLIIHNIYCHESALNTNEVLLTYKYEQIYNINHIKKSKLEWLDRGNIPKPLYDIISHVCAHFFKCIYSVYSIYDHVVFCIYNTLG